MMEHKDNTYVYGDWTDSNGDVNPVRYKRMWGSHEFTDEENENLLAGKEISFPYRGRTATGHLQYYSFQGKECFGFKANYSADEYDRKPVFHQRPQVSSFASDLEKENSVMAEYMRRHYYAKLLNSDGSSVSDFQRATDTDAQKAGIDVTYTRDGKRYIVDEKAQMDYIYKDAPLPTFSLELLAGTSGAIGWFINSALKTEYYMFIWPHAGADSRPLSVDRIEYALYALVSKKKLLAEVQKRYGKSPEQLLEYAKRMAAGGMGEEQLRSDRSGRQYLSGYRYKEDSFDDMGYLYYTVSKQERPVNLVVRRSWLEEMAEDYGEIR